MRIYCTKEEFMRMSNNCTDNECCDGCVLDSLCENKDFLNFISGVDCEQQ